MLFYSRKLAVFLFIIFFVHGLQAQNTTKEKVSGDVYFRGGPSSRPVYPRGDGRNEHWETGINLKLGYKNFEFYFMPAIAGAATFDNPDRFQFGARALYHLPRKFSLEGIVTDSYALNNIPPVDPASRRPTSGVNAFWLGGTWGFEKYQNQISIFARYAVRTDEPVFFTHFTKPYVRWNLGAAAEGRITEKVYFILEPSVYIGHKIDDSRGMLNLGLERRFHDDLFRLGGYYTVDRNLGLPQGITDFRGAPLRKTADRLFFGIKVPFGEKH